MGSLLFGLDLILELLKGIVRMAVALYRYGWIQGPIRAVA